MLVAAVTLMAIAYISDGTLLQIEGDGFADQFWPALFAAVLFAFVNATLGLLLKVLTFPLSCLTFGLFAILINVGLFYLVAWIVPGFELIGFWQTFAVALIMAIVTGIASWLIDRD
jgi:putative membrane protein